MDGNEFTMGYLKTMRVVRNCGTHWEIVDSNVDDGEQPVDQYGSQPRPRRNVRSRGARGQSVCQPAPIVGADFGGDMTGYFDQLAFVKC